MHIILPELRTRHLLWFSPSYVTFVQTVHINTDIGDISGSFLSVGFAFTLRCDTAGYLNFTFESYHTAVLHVSAAVAFNEMCNCASARLHDTLHSADRPMPILPPCCIPKNLPRSCLNLTQTCSFRCCVFIRFFNLSRS